MTDSDSPPAGDRPVPRPEPSAPIEQTAPHPRVVVPRPQIDVRGRVGGNVVAGDLRQEQNAGRDIVGRDVVTNTTTNSTTIGFGVAAVQRLVVTVGVLVFVTAACFFSGGLAAGAGIVALTRPLNSNNPAAADRFAAALAQLRALPAGQRFQLSFSEEEISSYFRLLAAPTLPGNITDGKVRLLASGQVVIGGRAGSLGGLAFAATFNWQNVPGRPLRLTSAALQVLPLGNAVFGWVAVPPAVLGSVETSVNSLFGNVQITGLSTSADGQTWIVNGVAQ